jgi:hypothetical protein
VAAVASVALALDADLSAAPGADERGFAERMIGDMILESQFPSTLIRHMRRPPDTLGGGIDTILEEADQRHVWQYRNFVMWQKFIANKALDVVGGLSDAQTGMELSLATKGLTRHIGSSVVSPQKGRFNPINPNNRSDLCVPSVAALIHNKEKRLGLDFDAYETVYDMMKTAKRPVSRQGNPISSELEAIEFLEKAIAEFGYKVSRKQANFVDATSPGHYLVILRSKGEAGHTEWHAVYGGIAPNGAKYIYDPSAGMSLDIGQLGESIVAYKIVK